MRSARRVASLIRGDMCAFPTIHVCVHAIQAQWLVNDGDITLYRFLMSRNWDLAMAEDMFRTSVEWRTRTRIRTQFAEWSRPSEEALLPRPFFYAGRAGHTRDGMPVNVERVGRFDVPGVLKATGMRDWAIKVRALSHAVCCQMM